MTKKVGPLFFILERVDQRSDVRRDLYCKFVAGLQSLFG